MKNQLLHIGCSSYNNGYWKGIFYPEDMPRSQWFEYYCQQFNTYEINASFYKFPTVKSLQGWYHKAPENFRFAVKAPKLITHLKQFTDCRSETDEFYSTCHKGLGQKLGCILFQLPPSFEYTAHKLALVLSYMNPDFCNVIEFRNESWWRSEVYEAFADKEVVFCNVSYPQLPTTLVQSGKVGYFRMHGVPKLFKSEYSEEELKQLYEAIKLSDWNECYLYFNNTASQAGIVNALAMKAMHQM